MRGTDIRKLVAQKEEEDRKKDEKKKEREEKKEETKCIFLKCKEKCVCGKKKCDAIDLQQCSVCKNVLKSKCGKKGCRNGSGELPVMIMVAARKDTSARKNRKRKQMESDQSDREDEGELEDDDSDHDMWNTTDDESFSGFENDDTIPDIKNGGELSKVNPAKSILFILSYRTS